MEIVHLPSLSGREQFVINDGQREGLLHVQIPSGKLPVLYWRGRVDANQLEEFFAVNAPSTEGKSFSAVIFNDSQNFYLNNIKSCP